MTALCRSRPPENFDGLLRIRNDGRSRFPAKSLLGSVAIHSAVLALALSGLFSGEPSVGTREKSETDDYKIYYLPPPQSRPKTLVRIEPAGPGGTPGAGTQPDQTTDLRSSVFRKQLTIVSNPPHPDNRHQTIITPLSPPDLRITQDLRLPNIVLGSPTRPPIPVTEMAQARRPGAAKQEIVTDRDAPQLPVTAQNVDLAMMGPAQAQAHLAIPIGSIGSPRSSGTTKEGADQEGLGENVLIVSTDPGGSGWSGLPPGSRLGEFSMSPALPGEGSPGGTGAGGRGGAAGGSGPGGDASVGVGLGISGGGGGRNAISGSLPLSAKGLGVAGVMLERLTAPAAGIEEMIMPVIAPLHVRQSSVVVSAGPIGGGGLAVYHALDCGKIYTIFVPMPGTSWTLQYCVHESPAATPPPSGPETVVHLGQALVAPDALAKFDFRRLPVSDDKVRKMIVLKGTIRDDGVVESVSVYQGLLPQMDEAARTAFGRWKFAPAMRGGKPVAVSVMVGILPAAGTPR